MRFDRFIQVLLPHDEKFYSFFEESAQNLVNACQLLKRLPLETADGLEQLVIEMHKYEHQGDTVTHNIFAELSATFVTPFDREDIHVLASALDDIMDYIDGCTSRFLLYKVEQCPKDMIKLIDILYNSVIALRKGVSLLRDFRKIEQLQEILREVNEDENEADSVFENAIANLFKYEKDPIQLIKLKEIYVGLETATDKCEDAANVLESLLIKHG
jgi:predicted phosphate transport protein (TIGR00153 family)